MPPTITGVFTIRNAIEAGYPFAEAIVSVLPIVDEFLINDGGSDDGTRAALERFRDQYPDTITLYDMPDYESDYWDCIDSHLEALIDEASGDWILEAQADEIWHEADVDMVRDVVATADTEGCRSIRQPRLNYPNFNEADNIHYTVRLVKTVPNLQSYHGGDNFQLGEVEVPPHDYSTHHVPPEYETGVPFYHFPHSFPDQRYEQYRRHAEWLATEQGIRQDRFDQFKDRMNAFDTSETTE